MKNSIFPNKIELLGETFIIKEVNKGQLYCDKCGDEYVGHLDYEKKIITVTINAEDSTPQEILFHELGHYYNNYYGIGGKNEVEAEAFGKFLGLVIKQLGFKK